MVSKKVIIAILIFANIISWSIVFDSEKPRNLETCFFDVGQGDSILIKTPYNQQILIDGGPSSVAKKLSSKMSLMDKTIDLVVLTHPHSDHLYGLLEVFDKFQIKNLLWTGQEYEGKAFDKLKNLIEKEGANVFIAKKGLKISFDENGFLEVLHPLTSLENSLVDSATANNSSIVLMLNHFGDKILFTGDISSKQELSILKDNQDVSADILKVSHHGSKSATSDYFLQSVSPALAVISVGENNYYGHPAPETLNKLKDIKVARTDKNGDICLTQKKIGQFSLSSQTE